MSSGVAPPNWAENAPRSLQGDIIACAVITWVIALTLVGLRLYTRTRIIRVLGPTDWCIALAAVTLTGYTAGMLEQAARGAGKHYWEIDPAQSRWIIRASWYGILFYSLTLTITKVSILLLYKRIFNYGWLKQAIKFVLFAVLVIGAWMVSTICTACVPLEAFWDWTVFFKTFAYCQPYNEWWANSGLHIATDIIIVLLPIPALSTLRLPRRQMVAVIGVFTLGFFVCIVSILRLIKLIQFERTQTIDPNYEGAELDFWTTIEVNTAVSCACIMTLKPLIVHFFPGLLAPTDMTDPTLAPVTARSRRTSGTDRSSRQSLARRGPQMAEGHHMSEIQSPRVAVYPRTDGHDFGTSDDGFKTPDLEAQRDDSVTSSTLPDEDATLVFQGTLRPPPKPRLRHST